jgi:hypothetical protein
MNVGGVDFIDANTKKCEPELKIAQNLFEGG